MQKIMFNDKYGLTEAVLSGKKTQTRRICNLDLYDLKKNESVETTDIILHEGVWMFSFDGNRYYPMPKQGLPKYKIDEVIAVAQSYKDIGYGEWLKLKSTNDKPITKLSGWNNKMFVKTDLMPHHIRITKVRVERLQDISDEDCIAEGIGKGRCGSADTHFMDAYYFPKPYQPYGKPREAYADLIDKISGKGTWDKNPWVYVYDFELIKDNTEIK